MNKQVFIVILLLVLVFGGLFGGRAWVNHRNAVAAAGRGAPARQAPRADLAPSS